MIYPSDFDYYRKYRRYKRAHGVLNVNANTKSIIDQKPKKSLWKRYCENTGVHGFGHVSNSEENIIERIIWIILMGLAAFGIVYLSFLSEIRFRSEKLSTVIDSNIYPVYKIAFPAVTLCNYNRVNIKKIPKTVERFLPNGTERQRSIVSKFLELFDTVEYGDFHKTMEVMKIDYPFSEFDHINVTELLDGVSDNCEELFVHCRWLNSLIDCCTIFFKQRTEYGICYTFNSLSTEFGMQRNSQNKSYPWRTTAHREKTGLRIRVQIDKNAIRSISDSVPGLLIAINNPIQWPNAAYFIPSGNAVSFLIKPTYSETTQDTKRLTPQERECVFWDEILKKQVTGYETLPGTIYTRSNCISACRQRNLNRICNCSMEVFFPNSKMNRPCRLKDFVCLSAIDDWINFVKPPGGNKYFSGGMPGIVCDCLPECRKFDYGFSMRSRQNTRNLSDYQVHLDIRYDSPIMIKYRTFVAFDWLNLLVSFGGILNLFLGISLVNIAEIVFYLLIGIEQQVGKWKKK